MRVWERSVGITNACGSGSCASAFIAFRKGLVDSKVEVFNPGGKLTIQVSSENDEVIMTGPAVQVFRGFISYSSLII